VGNRRLRAGAFADRGLEGKKDLEAGREAAKLNRENFKGPFIVEAGWGTFEQSKTGTAWRATLTVKHGSLHLTTLRLPWLAGDTRVRHHDRVLAGTATPGTLTFAVPLTLQAGDRLAVG
jgi:hypothetical protein